MTSLEDYTREIDSMLSSLVADPEGVVPEFADQAPILAGTDPLWSLAAALLMRISQEIRESRSVAM